MTTRGDQILDRSADTISLHPQAALWLDSAAFRQHATAGLVAAAALLWTLLTGRPPRYGDPEPLSWSVAGVPETVEHAMRRALRPMIRARYGRIVNISSVAGLVGSAGLGAYDASKAGLELLSEALHTEVAPLGINVTIVEPGNIRTQWAGRSMVFAKERIADYDATAGVSRTFYPELSGKQIGEASVVASAIRAAVAADEPPLRLVVGEDAHGWIKDKLDQEYSDLAHWQPSSE